MMPHQLALIVYLILATFNSHPTCIASTNADSSSIAQISRAYPEGQQKWVQSSTVAITADDERVGSNSLDKCKEECKNTDGCVAVKYHQNANECVILRKPIKYGNLKIVNNGKTEEAVLHVRNCRGKFVYVLHELSSLSNGYFTICLFAW
ncbi:hypothetical protein EG68_02552 [Paragonimus skrjabini miyazakii]|uniref:Apple domain-containing protein n=1 Tax=Paragonimus skrjabini miyazakii TaxID=59628 RepID=A0A8S9Z4D6_9TREM|nr:hypothetical protein EG68_02552 [Paragonimus skrjabini miyazakii]